MNTEINQKISQLLDDELHSTEEEFLLRKISRQPELKSKMNRYHAVSQVLKTDDFVMVNESFLENINQQLKQEPAYFLPRKKVSNKSIGFWSKTSLAIAASVAVVAVMLPRQAEFQNQSSIQSQVSLFNTVPQNQISVAKKNESSVDEMQIAKKPLTQHERFKAYLQAHSDDIYTHGSLTYQPFASVASYGRE